LAAFFEPLSVHLPAETRWWTFGPTLSVQAGGFLCHQIMPRVILAALDPEVNDNNVAAQLPAGFSVLLGSIQTKRFSGLQIRVVCGGPKLRPARTSSSESGEPNRPPLSKPPV